MRCVRRTATRCNALQRTAKRCYSCWTPFYFSGPYVLCAQYTATRYKSLEHIAPHCATLRHTASHCVLLQHTATDCNRLQQTATDCNTGHVRSATPITPKAWSTCARIHIVHLAATYCTTLQHTATHCNTLQHTATHCTTLHHTAAHSNALQHTATGNQPNP